MYNKGDIMNSRPNIILFFSDQQRWDTCGCYGQKLDITPNLDQMASEGVLFENAYTNQPVCGPARAIIQTGIYAAALNCFRNGIALPEGQKTIANYLNEAGYETAYVGKWHLATNRNPANIDIGARFNYETRPVPENKRGGYKDFWIASDVLEFTSHGYDGHMFDGDMNKREFKGYRVDATTDFALEYLENRKTDKPFFLMVSYIEPHHQNDRNRYEGPKGSKKRFRDYEVPGDLVGTRGDWRKNYPDYLGCCRSLDDNLGRIRAELEEQGILDNTVIIYTSDHGSHFRTRNSEYKRACHDGCTRVPLVITGPGFKRGERRSEFAATIDLAPTILSAAGIEKPGYMTGLDLEGQIDRESVYIQISESQVGRAIVTKEWKYSVEAPELDGTKDPASNKYTEKYLYNLKDDPHERNNLVDDPAYRKIRDELREILQKDMKEAGEETAKIYPYK